MHPITTQILEEPGLSASARTLFTIYDSMFRSMPAAVALLDGGGRVVALNTEWERLMGPGFRQHMVDFPAHTYAEAAHLLGLWDKDTAGSVNQALHDMIAGRSLSFCDELPVSLHNMGAWHRVSLVPLDPGNFDGVVAMHVDVTEQRRLREEMERFIYVAAHDLQEPLRTIASYVQLLDRRYKGRLDADADVFIDFAVEGAKRLSALIRDLLTYSRLAGSRHEEKVDLRDCVADVLHVLDSAIIESKANIKIGPLPVVRADRVQMTSLFQNLIANSIKYRAGDRPLDIIISSESRGEMCELVVTDTGQGIAADYHGKVFEMFERLQPQDGLGGTGIGLAIVKRIVESLGGRIWIVSGENEGAAFHFTLPVA